MGVWNTHKHNYIFLFPTPKRSDAKMKGKIGVKKKEDKTKPNWKERTRATSWMREEQTTKEYLWFLADIWNQDMRKGCCASLCERKKVVHRCVKKVFVCKFIYFLICFISPYSFTKHEHFFASTTVFLLSKISTSTLVPNILGLYFRHNHLCVCV